MSNSFELNKITTDTFSAAGEVLTASNLLNGDVFIVGCSTSEAAGEKIGSASSPEIARAVWQGLYDAVTEFEKVKNIKINLAVQCCEHLNRALVINKSAALLKSLEIVNAVPHRKAGGAFAEFAYSQISDSVLVEFVSARAGLDIGATLIGMHMKHVAVPLRLNVKKIGEAPVFGAYSRPKYIGGPRAEYN